MESNNIKKIDFTGATINREQIYREREEISGKEVILSFKIEVKGDFNGKEMEDKFRDGQDFEYVKFRLAQKLNIESSKLKLIYKDKPIITIYSICDIDYKPKEIIVVQEID